MPLRQERVAEMECLGGRKCCKSFLTGQRTFGVLTLNLSSRVRKSNHSVFNGFTSFIFCLLGDLGEIT